MSRIFHFLLTLLVIVISGILINRDHTNIHMRFIIQLLMIEVLFAYFFLNSKIAMDFVINVSDIFNKLLSFSEKGISFVFGNMKQQGLGSFFLNVLCPIIFMSALIGILHYVHVLPIFIHVIGTLLSMVNGMGKLESFNALSSLILGQSANFIVYKEILEKISERRMFSMVVTAMSTVSMSIVGVYMTILAPKYVLVALVLNMFSTFVVLLLLNPYQINAEEKIQMPHFYNSCSFFEMLGDYILSGFRVVVIISAMLIGFIGLISCVNALFDLLFGINFQKILGYICFPFAWLMGTPVHEALQVGSIMATKLLTNECVAMIDLQKISSELSPRSVGILSVFLVSFTNFSSIGILTGAIKGINKQQGNIVSRFGLKLVYSSALVSILSASITGLVI